MQGCRCALVSSSLRPIVDAVLAAIGTEHFAVTVSGDDVAQTKPNPDPYLLAAELLGVDPVRCVAFEDSETGATSAVAAGCLTVVVPSLVPVYLRSATTRRRRSPSWTSLASVS